MRQETIDQLLLKNVVVDDWLVVVAGVVVVITIPVVVNCTQSE